MSVNHVFFDVDGTLRLPNEQVSHGTFKPELLTYVVFCQAELMVNSRLLVQLPQAPITQ
jgi:hypothetical protein